ncbi:NAD(P)H-dependent flavin oxidoreductase [Pontibacillus litoralis]|uniref:Probable nitronate monooxygenase n=1 Tax=Pontibacillus litoralis JSM 072002 TaxID=1385512 RepID=A0A0A5G701_9BACI|nr:nitronate monooxygenase [Pontibacillus litoralis]KGX86880.1 2-nitropropane dioxygenase [Pontibacillus litoralis JSM 072002]
MNQLCEQLHIKYPIIQGGMGDISHETLTAAITEAGGLGTIGVGTMSVEEVDSKIQATKELTDKPFAVNIPLNVTPYKKEMIQLVNQYDVPIVSLSAGNPAPYVNCFHERGVKVLTVVGSKRQAVKAEMAGVDVIVAEGFEAAGINSPFETTTLSLIPQIVQSVSVPVVAAGGIADGYGLAAMLALGASGVQMGTRFIATKEAPFHSHYKQAVMEAKDNETVIVGRSVGQVRRVLKKPYTEKLLQYEQEGITVEQFQQYTSEHFHKRGALEGNAEEGFMNAGQICGFIDTIPTVEQLIQSMMEQYNNRIQQLQPFQP